MGVNYPIVSDNQRVDIADFNTGQSDGLGNLTRALARFLQPTAGIFRGGRVKATGPASKNVIVEPLAGISDGLELLILDNDTVLAVPDNGSGNPRIDLVSVHAVTIDYPQQSRAFWNAGTETEFTQNTVVRRALNAVPVLTVGTPAATPAAPALPAGHIALATIQVADGFAAVVGADIGAVSAPDPLIAAAVTDAGNQPLPFEPAARIRVSTRAGGVSLLFAVLTITDPAGATIVWDAGPEVPAVHTALRITIEEVGGGVVATAFHRMLVGDIRTIVVAGIVPGPRDAVEYQLRIEDTLDTPSAHPAVGWVLLRLSDAPGVLGALSL